MNKLNDQHRKERKDLQSRITALRKTVTKGDKKKKKEVDANIESLERDFEQKCQFELDQLQEKFKSAKTLEEKSEFVKSLGDTQNKEEDESIQNLASNYNQKVSKAKKRKEKKEKNEQDREQAIALQEIENQKGPALLELKRIQEKLRLRGLQVKDVKSDGNCMYYAVADQLSRNLSISKTWHELREKICDYMLENPDNFQPYITTADGDLIDSDKYQEYCEKIRDTLVWGGQLELKALADVLGVLIEVVQNEGSELVIGNETDGKAKLIVTYHRHMFGAGEHYNSTEPYVSTDDSEEN